MPDNPITRALEIKDKERRRSVLNKLEQNTNEQPNIASRYSAPFQDDIGVILERSEIAQEHDVNQAVLFANELEKKALENHISHDEVTQSAAIILRTLGFISLGSRLITDIGGRIIKDDLLKANQTLATGKQHVLDKTTRQEICIRYKGLRKDGNTVQNSAEIACDEKGLSRCDPRTIRNWIKELEI